MIMFKSTFKPIFDAIEEAEPIQALHSWKDTDESSIKLAEILFKKQFSAKKQDGIYEEGMYFLIPFNLIKLLNNKYYVLSLKNTRILKVNDATKKLYGIKISGFKGQDEIYSQSIEDQKMLFTLLKGFCTCFHLMNEFNLIKIIGRGNF